MCSVDGCNRKACARNMCRRHYDRWRRYGDTNSRRRERPDDVWGWVRKTRGCWLWIGPGQEYGVIDVDGVRWRAHRYIWTITQGPIPEGAILCHTCDRPLCVNPAHLYVGTAQTNADDAKERGRIRSGTQRLTKRDILKIRQLREEGWSVQALGQKFGIHWTHVSDICNRKRWKSVP